MLPVWFIWDASTPAEAVQSLTKSLPLKEVDSMSQNNQLLNWAGTDPKKKHEKKDRSNPV